MLKPGDKIVSLMSHHSYDDFDIEYNQICIFDKYLSERKDAETNTTPRLGRIIIINQDTTLLDLQNINIDEDNGIIYDKNSKPIGCIPK